MASRKSNHHNQSQDPYNQKHKSNDQLTTRHHHQQHRRQERTSSENHKLSTNVNTTRAITTRESKSISQSSSLSIKEVHGSTSSGHHQQLSTTVKVSHTQYHESSFDGHSTMAVNSYQFQTNLSSTSTSHLSTKVIVHGSKSGNSIKPPVQLQQHHGTSQSIKAVHGSKSGNIKQPPTNRLSTKAVHGSKSSNIKPPPVRR